MSVAYHTLAADAVCRQLATSPEGLTGDEADRRLARTGPNRLQSEAPLRPWRLLAQQFANVLVLILLVGAGVSAVLGEVVDAVAIVVIVLLAVILGFVQEYRAERSLAALRKLAAPAARVLRDGREREVPAEQVVPGDVLLLAAGQRVSADARLLTTVNLKLDEAVLTGESVPVAKAVEPLPAETPLAERTNLVFAGTTVSYGRGRAVVTGTGMATEFGRIAGLLQGVEQGRTPLQQALDRTGRMLARAALVIVGLIVLCGLWRGQPWLEMLLFGIALAVAVVPEALPAVVTISLALGVQRMVRRHALMRRLPAVETLGCTTVICTDKTGTLTRNQMLVRRLWVAGGNWHMRGEGYGPEGTLVAEGEEADPAPARRLLRAAALASDAVVHHDGTDWRLQGDPTEGALVAAAARAGLAADGLAARWPRLEEVPFSAETRWMATRHQGNGESLVCLKGAPEEVLARCDRWLTTAGEAPLTAADRERILARAHALAGEALRVLAAADGVAASLAEAPQGLVFLGLAGMLDPPRAEAAEAVATCRRAGIRVLMLTGDHPRTAAAIAGELGIGAGEAALTGADLDALDEAGLEAILTTQSVYARVSPEHKLRLVRALQRQGEVTAMTGDGVNDAPALKQADIGIAMGLTGTDVSREAADMTLTDDNFASIVAAVEEGRIVFGNIRKFLIYLLSANIGEIGLMAGAVLLGLPLPLTAVQILYLNLATDGLPALALAVDPPAPELMSRPPRPRGEGVFTPALVALMLAGGTVLGLLLLGLFAGLLHTGWPAAETRTLVFVALVLCEFHKTYLLRPLLAPAWRHPFANRWLNRALLWELTLLLLLVYAPPLQRVFGTFPLSARDWLLVLGTAALLGPLVEGIKLLLRRWEPQLPLSWWRSSR